MGPVELRSVRKGRGDVNFYVHSALGDDSDQGLCYWNKGSEK